MSKQQSFTPSEVLQITVGILENIQVPVKYKAQISDKIASAIVNINAVIEAFNSHVQQPEEEAETIKDDNQADPGNAEG